MSYLTSHAEFDILHRRAGRDARPRIVLHADAHKYCPLGRCGTRTGAYSQSSGGPAEWKTAKIVAWRKAKAVANRAYLEEHVYDQS